MTTELFPQLFDVAERVRWRLTDIPWDELVRDQVTPSLIQLVRDIVASEATTFSATQRFLQDFADDVDLTSWMAIWFYEETKHPQVLLRWLEQVGERMDPEAIRRARVTVPFMKSRMATLVMNIISELVASARYLDLRAESPEPLLAKIAEHLAGDEARHASSFLAFAKQRLGRSTTPDDERRDALKVLYKWATADDVRHPVSLFRQGIEDAREHVFRMIGGLCGLQLRTVEDVHAALR